MKAQKVIVLQGLPASGKSTWAREFVSKNQNWARINKDDLRAMMHSSQWSKKNEEQVLVVRDQSVRGLLLAGFNVIVDDTNFEQKHILRIQEICSTLSAKVEVEVKFFDVSLEECLKRNKTRANSVPEDVIYSMHARYIRSKTEVVSNNPENPPCIVCDLDGTLALMEDRGPYDFGKVYEDSVNKPVWSCLKRLLTSPIVPKLQLIFVSGRDDSCTEETVRWLKEKCGFGVGNYLLYMRKTGDRRKDSVVKEEIYKNYVLPRYHVQFVLDDRQQVVNHLREMGLPVFQVAPGNF